MRVRNLGALLAALLFALPAVAQENRGAIDGLVKDAQGAAIPGATVSASTGAGLTVSAVTDATGHYRFPSLPPGKYTVTATMPGFSSAKVQDVRLALGQLLSVDMTLTVGGVTETIEVTVEAPLIDTKSSARSQNLREEALTKVPRGRDFTTVVTQAPGANNESRLGGLSIDGSSAAENRYVIDGVETTNLQTGVSGKNLITDFVDEVQVKSSGYAAEYGGATGGVVNVITKSGTNQWRGDVGSYFGSDALGYSLSTFAPYADGRPVLRRNPNDPNIAEYVTYDKDSYTRLEPGFSVGGPLKKDKIWLFAAYQPSLETQERDVKLLLDGSTASGKQKTTAHYFSLNVTSQLSDKTRARLAFNSSGDKQDGQLPALDGSDSPGLRYADIVRTRPNWSLSGNVDFIASSNLFFGLRGGYYFTDTKWEGVPEGPQALFLIGNVGQARVPDSFERATGFTNKAVNFGGNKDQFTRLGLQFDGTYFASFAGQHAFKAGVQFDRLANNVDSGEVGNRVRFYWNGTGTTTASRGVYGTYRVRSQDVDPKRGFLTVGDISVSNLGLFLQDSWTISDRFTLNLGLRTESEKVPSFSADSRIPATAIEFKFQDKLAPRAGLAWDIKGDGRWKAYASWGIFYDITKLEMPRGSFGGDKWLEYYYKLETYDWQSVLNSVQNDPNCPPACPGGLYQGPIDFRHPSNDPEANSIDPDIKPFKLQEAVLGFEHELSKSLSVSARYVHKEIIRAVEDIGTLDAQQNEIYVIGNPGEGMTTIAHILPDGSRVAHPKAQRDYDGVELALTKRMADNWYGRVSYLWSRLYGNYSGLSQSDENGRVSPNVGRNFDYPVMSFDQTGSPVFGNLPTDRTHQFKTQLVYDFSFGTTVGLNAYVASGIPVTREAAYIPGNEFPVQYLGRESDGRTPMFSQFDLYLQHEIKVGGNRRLQLSANVLNVLNQEGVTNRFRTQLAPGNAVNVSEDSFYRGVDFTQLIAAQGLVQDSRFLKDSEYQAPRTVRFGLKFIF